MTTYLFKGSEPEQLVIKQRPLKKIRMVKDTKQSDEVEVSDAPVAKNPQPPSGRRNFLVVVSLRLSLHIHHRYMTHKW